MGYTVEDLRMSLGRGDMWIGVPVWCYMECTNVMVVTPSQLGTPVTPVMPPDFTYYSGSSS